MELKEDSIKRRKKKPGKVNIFETLPIEITCIEVLPYLTISEILVLSVLNKHISTLVIVHPLLWQNLTFKYFTRERVTKLNDFIKLERQSEQWLAVFRKLSKMSDFCYTNFESIYFNFQYILAKITMFQKGENQFDEQGVKKFFDKFDYQRSMGYCFSNKYFNEYFPNIDIYEIFIKNVWLENPTISLSSGSNEFDILQSGIPDVLTEKFYAGVRLLQRLKPQSMITPLGFDFTGECVDNKPIKGTYRQTTMQGINIVFVGEFDNHMHGSGVMTVTDSKVPNYYMQHHGEFKWGSRINKGICYYIDGSFSKGLFKSYLVEGVNVSLFHQLYFEGKFERKEALENQARGALYDFNGCVYKLVVTESENIDEKYTKGEFLCSGKWINGYNSKHPDMCFHFGVICDGPCQSYPISGTMRKHARVMDAILIYVKNAVRILQNAGWTMTSKQL